MLQTSPLNWRTANDELDFNIERADNLMWANPITGEWEDLPKRRAVLFNPDNGQIYSDNASINYVPAPYTELWDQLHDICFAACLHDPEIFIHKATNTFGTAGSSVRGDLIFYNEQVKAQPHVDDYIALRLSFFASYDLSWSVQIKFAGHRLWCTNGCFHTDFAVRAVERHTKAIDLTKYKNVIFNARERFSESGAMYQAMACKQVPYQAAMDVLAKLAYVPTKPEKTHDRYEHHSKKQIELLDQHLTTYFREVGHTKWAAYNAATHWSSHFKTKGQFAKQQTDREQKVARLFQSKEWAEL